MYVEISHSAVWSCAEGRLVINISALALVVLEQVSHILV